MVDLLLGVKIGASGGPQTVREVRRIDDQVRRLQQRNEQAAATAKALGEAYQLGDDEIQAVTNELIKQQKAADDSRQAFEDLAATEQAIRQLQDALEPDQNANKLLQSLGDIVDSSEDVADIARRLSGAFDLDDQQVDELARSLEQLGQEGQDTAAIARQLSDAFDLPDAEADALVRQLRQLENAAKNTDGQVDTLGNRISEIGIAIKSAGVDLLVDSLRGVADAAKQVVGSALDEFERFDTAGANAATLVDDVDVLKAELKDLGEELQGAASQNELLEASYDVLSAGFTNAADAAEILEVSTKAAIGGQSDLATVSDAVTSTLNAYNLEASDAEAITDKFFATVAAGKINIEQYSQQIGKVAPLANQAGVSLDELNGFIATATALGVPVESAFSGIRQAISATLKPTNEASELAEELGIRFDATALQSKGLAGILGELNATGQDTSENLTVLFGSVEAVTAIAPSTGEGFAKLTENIKGSEESTGLTNENFEKLANTLGFLKIAFENFIEDGLLAFGTAIAPIATTVLEFLSSVLSFFQQNLSFDSLTASAERLNAVLNENPEIAQAVGQALADIAGALTELLSNQLIALTQYLQENPQAIQENAEKFQELATNIIKLTDNILAVLTALSRLSDFFTFFGEQAFNAVVKLIENINLLASVLDTTLSPILDRIGEQFRRLQDFADGLIEQAGNLPGVGNLIPQPRFTGGPLTAGGLYSIAERGPEVARIGAKEYLFQNPALIQPQTSGYVYNAAQTAQRMSFGGGDSVASLRRDIQHLTSVVKSRPATQSRDTYNLNTRTPTQDAARISAGKLRNMARYRGLG